MDDHHQDQSSSTRGGAEPQHAGLAVVADDDDNTTTDTNQRHLDRSHDTNNLLLYRPRHVITSEAQHTNSLPPLPPISDDVITPQTADAYLARTLNSLSLEERTKAIEDVHGVSTIQEESSSFLQDCLQRLDDEISKLPEEHETATTTTATDGSGGEAAAVDTGDGFFNKYAYNLAMQQDPKHVQSLRILFLRSESFHIQHAAIRMVSYFDAKLDLFGPELLTKDITIHDIEQCSRGSNNGISATDGSASNTKKDDIDCLNTGYIQLLPSRDRSGRPIACWIPGLIKDPQSFAIESKVRYITRISTVFRDTSSHIYW